jgi:hypothetical protein
MNYESRDGYYDENNFSDVGPCLYPLDFYLINYYKIFSFVKHDSRATRENMVAHSALLRGCSYDLYLRPIQR